MDTSWSRMPGEPYRWYDRMDKYFRQLGPERTIEEAWRNWKQSGASRSRARRPSRLWYEHAKRWDWVGRCQDFDEHQRRLDFLVEQKAHDEMRARHTNLGIQLQIVGNKAMTRYSKLEDESDIPVLGPSDARLSIKDGISVERTARGLPVELLALYEMSDEELQKEYERSSAALRGHDPSPQSDRDGDAGQGPGADTSD